MGQDRLRRVLLIATIAALSLTALIAIGALIAAEFGETELRILATTAGFGFATLLAMRGTVLLDQGRHLRLARAVIGLSALAFVVELWPVWINSDDSAPWKSYVCVIAVAVALAQIAGMLGRRRAFDPPSIRVLIWAAGICAITVAAMAILAALAEIGEAGYYQLFGVVVVLNVLAIALQLVVRRLGSPAPTAGDGDRFVCVLSSGRRIERTAGPDLADSVARALRELNDHDERVTRIELGTG
jgi:hypothetical protein